MSTPRAPRVPWCDSLAARISVGFLGLFVLVLTVQAAVLAWVMIRNQAATERDHAARLLLTQRTSEALAEAIERNPALDLATYMTTRPDGLALVMTDGRIFGRPAPKFDTKGVITVLNEGRSDIPTSWRTGPYAASALVVGDRLHGVIASAPPTTWQQIGPSMVVTATVLVLAGTMLASLLIVRPIRARLQALHVVTSHLGRGDLSARAATGGADEIAELSRAFNRMADELAARAVALETSDRLRRQLIADVSHELMTPLTAVIGHLDTLLMPELRLSDEQRRRQLSVAMREGRRLEHLIGDLLDTARLEAGGDGLKPERISVQELFDEIRLRHERDGQAKQIRFHAFVAPDAQYLNADPFRLEQAMENLVANAIRHTPDGGSVTLTATRHDGMIAISVADSGEGIAEEHLPFVFDRFYKAPPMQGPGSRGSGLGLSIVKAIVARHGGRVSATSTVGKGTTMTVEIPASDTAPSSSAARGTLLEV